VRRMGKLRVQRLVWCLAIFFALEILIFALR
jgi:hypothetical protein